MGNQTSRILLDIYIALGQIMIANSTMTGYLLGYTVLLHFIELILLSGFIHLCAIGFKVENRPYLKALAIAGVSVVIQAVLRISLFASFDMPSIMSWFANMLLPVSISYIAAVFAMHKIYRMSGPLSFGVMAIAYVLDIVAMFIVSLILTIIGVAALVGTGAVQ